ncbi:MAG: pyridoxal phosphate-dependent decarboxylase family protein [Gaiella sp.]
MDDQLRTEASRLVADGTAALEWIGRYLESLRQVPVLSRAEPGAIRSALPPTAPLAPEPFSAVLADLETVLAPGLTHWQSPRYFAYFATSSTEPGILAELLIAALNQTGIMWRTSPALQELEEVATSWLRDLVGLPATFAGHIEDTASTSAIAALATARSAAPGRRVVVASEHAHSSIDKACRLLELELRKVPGDANHALRLDRLDLVGACAVVATIGTTSSNAIDPVDGLADACADAGVWLHVDAAYAGPAAMCPELRPLFAGWERADSVCLNPHKWLATPIDCSTLYTRRVEAFRDAFSLVPEYLRTPDDAVNLSEISIPLGRRFRALKLWAVLRFYGADGLRERLREHVRLADVFASWVESEDGWEVCAPHPFSLVCFRRDGSDEENEALMHRVNDEGEIFLSHTKLDGRLVLRLAIGNFRTTEADVRLAWDVLRRAAG